jgi:hypothetical protein
MSPFTSEGWAGGEGKSAFTQAHECSTHFVIENMFSCLWLGIGETQTGTNSHLYKRGNNLLVSSAKGLSKNCNFDVSHYGVQNNPKREITHLLIWYQQGLKRNLKFDVNHCGVEHHPQRREITCWYYQGLTRDWKFDVSHCDVEDHPQIVNQNWVN